MSNGEERMTSETTDTPPILHEQSPFELPFGVRFGLVREILSAVRLCLDDGDVAPILVLIESSEYGQAERIWKVINEGRVKVGCAVDMDILPASRANKLLAVLLFSKRQG